MSDGMVQFNARESAGFARQTALAQIESLFDRLGSMRRALESGVDAEYLEADIDEVISQTHTLVMTWGMQATFEEFLK